MLCCSIGLHRTRNADTEHTPGRQYKAPWAYRDGNQCFRGGSICFFLEFGVCGCCAFNDEANGDEGNDDDDDDDDDEY